MRHHTKDKGDLAVGQVIADLIGQGIQVCLPISEHLPFDLVAVSSLEELARVQVKYVTVKEGVLRLRLQSSHSDRHGTHHSRVRLNAIDAFALFCPESRKVYYIRRDEISVGLRREFTIRLNPTTNGQVKRTRSVVQFEGAERIFGL